MSEYRDPIDIVDACHDALREGIDDLPSPEEPETTIATSRVLRQEAGIPPVEETHPLP